MPQPGDPQPAPEVASADEPPVLELHGVSKAYARDLRRAQRNGVAAILHEVNGGRGSRHGELRTGEFWAVRDASLHVGRGEAVGIVGRNGAGKSTLLRVAAGITQPASGEVVRRGTLGALLDPSAGFNTILSGRENVDTVFTMLSGRRPTKEMIDDIVAYAGVEEAIEHPVRTYSQGMRLRLGFSVMVHVEPDLLVIDEALAVGDTAFQLQCLEYLHAFCRAGGALVFVSHSLWLFQHLATRGIHLVDGRIDFEGHPEAVADRYLEDLQRGSWASSGDGPDLLEREQVIRMSEQDEPPAAATEQAADFSGLLPPEAGWRRPIRFVHVETFTDDGGPARAGERLHVRFDLASIAEFPELELAFAIWTADLSICVTVDSVHRGADDPERVTIAMERGRRSVTCTIDALPVLPGRYAIRAAVYDGPTSDVLGMIGFEDTPTWLEVRGPASSEGVDEPSARRRVGLRPLRSMPVQVVGAVGSPGSIGPSS